MNNVTTLIDAYTPIQSDIGITIIIACIAAVIGIASTMITRTVDIDITGQKTAEAALVAAAAKAIKLPTICITGIDNTGTISTEITQE